MELMPSPEELSLLLVEPSPTQQKIIRNALESAGVRHLYFADTVKSAIYAIKEHEPDLVVSAMYLSDGTAETLITLIKKHPETEHINFMLVSSERNRKQLESLRQAGVIAILPKPFSMRDLQRAINATLDLAIEQEIELELLDPHAMQVLLVDDSALAQKHITRVLESMGIVHIDVAVNGSDAVLLLEDGNYDLVITDYNMPEMDGKELANTIRSSGHLAHIPILMVASNADQPQLANVTQEGVDAICDKVFEPETLRRLLHNILD
ncbi:two-component system response regulator [Marinomonas piezotolerans]|uniref:Two-component system response regulator n=1 Tax=Marinomonas piezotolerans TaxID=2213058 RepID=A0A370U599_9GAMM|nr:response regulator [Marinomonas piezotolerans]RDL42956.1 two-component system response regulator [Marinomonas piezotolerans]